jgi:hypothetical protein
MLKVGGEMVAITGKNWTFSNENKVLREFFTGKTDIIRDSNHFSNEILTIEWEFKEEKFTDNSKDQKKIIKVNIVILHIIKNSSSEDKRIINKVFYKTDIKDREKGRDILLNVEPIPVLKGKEETKTQIVKPQADPEFEIPPELLNIPERRKPLIPKKEENPDPINEKYDFSQCGSIHQFLKYNRKGETDMTPELIEIAKDKEDKRLTYYLMRADINNTIDSVDIYENNITIKKVINSQFTIEGKKSRETYHLGGLADIGGISQRYELNIYKDDDKDDDENFIKSIDNRKEQKIYFKQLFIDYLNKNQSPKKSIKLQMKEGTYKPSSAVQKAQDMGMPMNASMAKFVDKLEANEEKLRPIRALTKSLEDLDKVKDKDVDSTVKEIERLIKEYASQPVNRNNKSQVEKGIRDSKSNLDMYLRNREYKKPKKNKMVYDDIIL